MLPALPVAFVILARILHQAPEIVFPGLVMRDAPNSPTNRQIVARFAAHLAHLLNAGEGVVAVNLFLLYQTVLQTLASRPYQRLIGARLVSAGRSGEEVARKYFEAVIDRRLFLVRANTTHKGHELLIVLARRGLDPRWQTAELIRLRELSGGANAAAPADFEAVAGRLAKLDSSLSPGNPAINTRERMGSLYLATGGAHAEVTEELSVWAAVSCSPQRLHKLAKGAEFDSFCTLIIKAVESANAPFGAFLAVGLSPYEWEGEISTNTLKKLGSFLNAVRAEIGETPTSRGDLETWRKVWTCRPVPGFATADTLWHSALGRAVRLPVVVRPIEWDGFEESIAQDGELTEPEDFEAELSGARAARAIDEFDMWLYREIYAGASIAELEDRPETLARFRDTPTDLAAYVEALTARVLAWTCGELSGAGFHPDNGDMPDEAQ